MLVSMDDQHNVQDSELSIRSRASSVISTGTKMSIGTIQEEQQPTGIDVLLGRRNFRLTRRPGSILSISSFDQPAPPYEGPSEQSSSIATLTSRHIPNSSPLAVYPHMTVSQSDDQVDRNHSSSTPVPESLASSVHPSDTPNALFHHYTEIVRTIDANNQAEIARLSSAQEHRNAEHAAELASLISAQNDELDDLTSEHAAEIDRVTNSIVQLERMNAKHVAELARLKSVHTIEVDRLVNSITELERAEAEHRADLVRLQSKHTTDLASTRNEIDKEYRKEFKVNRAEVEQTRQEAAAFTASFEKKCCEEVAQAMNREVRMTEEVSKQRLRYISEAEAMIERARNEMKEQCQRAVIETEEKCRKELKAKDLQIEHAHQQATSSVTEMEQRFRGEISQAEIRVHRARNEVEDVWEKRWKDRDQVSGEELKRLEEYWRAELRKQKIEAESREGTIWKAVRITCPDKIEQLEKILEESSLRTYCAKFPIHNN
ncbi:hypothetical protein MMC14_003297 [Varicellaria rhodocarpa]|nr:hypothetical protein [Varicellaria rhodocarpa]